MSMDDGSTLRDPTSADWGTETLPRRRSKRLGGLGDVADAAAAGARRGKYTASGSSVSLSCASQCVDKVTLARDALHKRTAWPDSVKIEGQGGVSELSIRSA